MKKYFSHVFNGVDMLYQTIDDPEFTLSVAVSGFIIADVSFSYLIIKEKLFRDFISVNSFS